MKRLLATLTACLALYHQGVYATACTTKQCYVDAYESVNSAKLPEVVRVQKIFDKLRAVVGTKQTIAAELLIIDSDGKPWAAALSDQTVVLTTGAIEIFYSEGDKELGDTRAAFVLGHELAHLNTQDLFHVKAFNGEKNYYQNPDSLNQEMRADLNGFSYASIAGYNTPRLLSGREDFFNYWAEQLPLVEGLKHPSTAQRSKNLQLAFSGILREIPFYRLGVVLAQAGRYKDAKNILTDYLKKGGAKTKELYINLGYTHLQLAREAMSDEQAYKYWIPTLLEFDAIEVTRSMFGGTLGEEALAHLNKAEEYLKIALDMDENDYVTLVNLTATYLYKPSSIHKAYASIKSAIDLDIASENLKIQLLSIYHLVRLADDFDGGDRWTAAKNWHENAINENNVGDNIIYNMARMLDDRGRDDAAQRYWKTLLERRDKLPAVYRERACVRMGLDENACNKNIKPLANKAWPARNVPVSVDVREKRAKKCLRQHWTPDVLARDVGDTAIRIYTDQYANEAIVIDNYVEVYLKRDIALNSEYGTVERLADQFGDFLTSQPTGIKGQALYKFQGASALVVNGYVQELWITQLPTTLNKSGAC